MKYTYIFLTDEWLLCYPHGSATLDFYNKWKDRPIKATLHGGGAVGLHGKCREDSFKYRLKETIFDARLWRYATPLEIVKERLK